MNLYFKFLVLLIKRLFYKKTLKMQDTCVSHFRVGLLDLDLNFHMNNGRFLSVMDLGRFDLLIQTGYFTKLFSNGFYPVVLSEAIVFNQSLHYGQVYQVKTRMDSWDKNFFYMTQVFFYKEERIASSQVRACFKKRGRRGIVPVSEVFAFLGEPYEGDEMSPLAKKQIELDDILAPRSKKST